MPANEAVLPWARDEPLDPVAATLWEIERDPRLKTTIVAVMLLDRPVPREALLDGLGQAARRLPRLRQRVVERPNWRGGPFWSLAPDFDLAHHVRFVDIDGPLDDARLAAVVEPLASTALRRDRPLWECTYVGGATGRAALVLRIHHSMTDGVGGVELLDVVLDRERTPATEEVDEAAVVPPTVEATSSLAAAAHRIAGRSVRASRLAADAARHPLDTAGAVQSAVGSAQRLLAPSSAPRSPLMVARSEERRIGTVDADLNRLRDVAHGCGCTVNHLFCAAVLGAVARYHAEHHRPVDGLRVTMPVNLRRQEDPRAGNRWAPVRLVVPAGIEDPLDRLLVLRDLLDGVRREPALPISDQLAGVLGRLPASISSTVVGGMMKGVDLTLTNVPGLREQRFLRGAEVERIYAFAPTAGAALNAAFISHGDRACIGLNSDAAAITDPGRLRDLVEQQLEAVLEAASRPDPDRVAALEGRPIRPAPPERLSALDTAFLRLERPDLPMHIGGIMLLDGGPLRDGSGAVRLDAIQRHVAARLRHLPRFRRRIAEVPLEVDRPEWVDDVDFDIARHVRVTSVPSPGGRSDLFELAARLFEVPLDRGAPLWELWVVDGLADGSVAIVEKVHHALIDGASGVELAMLLLDPRPDAPPEDPMWLPSAAPAPPLDRTLEAALERLRRPVRTARGVGHGLVAPPAQVLDRVGEVTAGVGQILGAAPPTPLPFNRTPGRRRVLCASDLDRGRLDRIRRPLDATVNDVVLSCVAGALGARYGGDPGTPDDLRVLVPVSTRHADMHHEPGNHVGAAVIDLPIDEPDPARRLVTIIERTRTAKGRRVGEGAAGVLDAVDHLPPLADRALVGLLQRRTLVHLVVTNVKGSPEPLYLLGAELVEAVPIVPLGPRLGLGIAVLSHTDHLVVSLLADPTLVPGLDEIADAIVEEFERLCALVEGAGEGHEIEGVP